MLTIVATFDRQTREARLHLQLDSASMPSEQRRAQARAKVEELEKALDPERFEVVYGVARTLREFAETDPRFFQLAATS